MPPPKDPIKYAEWVRKQKVAQKGKHDGEKNGRFGKPVLESTRQKIGEKNKNPSQKIREKIANGQRNRMQSEEERRKKGKSNTGKVRTETQREHYRVAATGDKNGMFGKHHSDSACKKMSSQRQGSGNHMFGKHHSYLARLKIIETKLGGFWYGNVRYYDAPQYCEKFNDNLKERVRAFFGYRCVECGATQNGKKLDVHHVWYNKKACCDGTPRSLVALCHKCHSKTTKGDRSYWSNHFQEMIDLYYGGRCWLTQDEMNALLDQQRKTLQSGSNLPGLM